MPSLNSGKSGISGKQRCSDQPHLEVATPPAVVKASTVLVASKRRLFATRDPTLTHIYVLAYRVLRKIVECLFLVTSTSLLKSFNT